MFGLAVAAGPGAGPALPAATAAFVPLAGLLGSLALPESPLHRERRAEQKLAVLRGESGGGWRDQVQHFPFAALKVFQVLCRCGPNAISHCVHPRSTSRCSSSWPPSFSSTSPEPPSPRSFSCRSSTRTPTRWSQYNNSLHNSTFRTQTVRNSNSLGLVVRLGPGQSRTYQSAMLVNTARFLAGLTMARLLKAFVFRKQHQTH